MMSGLQVSVNGVKQDKYARSQWVVISSAMSPVIQLRAKLVAALGIDAVLTDDTDIQRYCRDWHGDVQSGAVAVLRPAGTAAVSQALIFCNEVGLAVVPQGGNTGLVLGAIPDHAGLQVILSLERMNAIRELDQDNYSMIAEAGCILQTIQQVARQHDLLFPVSLGAEGSCQLGGNVSTNAGGINVLHYGMMREQVLGLEVVLPDGSVLNALTTLRKDNRGIDLKQLFIGAEGVLGVVTAVALRLWPQPEQVGTALLAVNSVDSAIALYRYARRLCCDLVTAFELMPPDALVLATEAMPDLQAPFAQRHPSYILLELSGGGLVNIDELLEQFLQHMLESGLVQDAVLARSETQAANLWRFREGMNQGQALRGLHLRSDVSVPISRIADFVAEVEELLRQAFPLACVISYGHLGDGNVHVNVLPQAGATREQRLALIRTGKDIINQCVYRYKGSISAEHGIGRLKLPEFEANSCPVQQHLMRRIKSTIDPAGLMNPGCLVRQVRA